MPFLPFLPILMIAGFGTVVIVTIRKARKRDAEFLKRVRQYDMADAVRDYAAEAEQAQNRG